MMLKLDSHVNDFSGIMNSEIIKLYNQKFFDYKQKSWVEIATVFIKHRNWRALKDIALEIFNDNWIGDKETNSWLLLIVVTEEKKIRIMTGKWMELEFPDSYCRDIIDWELRWLMNSWKYEELIQSWYELSSKSRELKKWKTKKKTSSNHKYYWVEKIYKSKEEKRKQKRNTLIFMHSTIFTTLAISLFYSLPWFLLVMWFIIFIWVLFTSRFNEEETVIHAATVFFVLGIPLFLLLMYLTATWELIQSWWNSRPSSPSSWYESRSSSSTSSSSRSSSSSSYSSSNYWWWSSNGWGAGD